MTSLTVTDRGGKTFKVIEIDGRRYPNFPVESLKNVSTIKARPSDVLLCTYPKSGTHWATEVVHFLLTGTSHLQGKDTSFIDLAPPSSLEAAAAPSPRILQTHFHFDKLSPGFVKQGCKIIYVTRDPRDVFVSYFNHKKNLKSYDGEWTDYFHLILEGKGAYGSWCDHTKGWEKAIREHPDHPFLVLTFEDMKQDPKKEIKRVADFLEVNLSDTFLDEVAEKTSFQSMKPRAVKYKVLFRKGEMGDWKNWFTVTQLEQFNQVFEKEMAGTKAYDLYSHTNNDKKDVDENSIIDTL